MIELLSNKVKAAIDDIRYDCVDYTKGPMCDTNYLLRLWEEAKREKLFKLLGNELIYETVINYERSRKEIETEMSEMAWNHPFINNYRNFVYGNVMRYELLGLTSMESLVENKWLGKTFYIQLPNGKKHKVQSGCKIIKTLQELSRYFEISDFDDFALQHSRILNQKKIEGTLCLSIHPLDYITMSDNDCDWDSCMSWRNTGEYRLGTVEMMNSPSVIVAYIKSRVKDYKITGNFFWSNKKWRELYIVDEDFICSVFGYPYENEDITNIVLNLLAELSEKNLGIKYHHTHYTYEPSKTCTVKHTNIKLYFDTGYMFSDFKHTHFCLFNKNIEVDESMGITHNYSGPSQCMICGNVTEDFNDASCLACDNCYSVKKCCRCEDRLEEDSGNIIYDENGDPWCIDCFYEQHCLCHICDEYAHEDDIVVIALVNDEDEVIKMMDMCRYCAEAKFKDKIKKIDLDSWPYIVSAVNRADIPKDLVEKFLRYGYEI